MFNYLGLGLNRAFNVGGVSAPPLVAWKPSFEQKCVMWNKADADNGLVDEGSDGFIETLIDQRLALDLTQSTVGLKPTLTTINAKTALSFDGIDDKMTTVSQSIVNNGSNVQIHLVANIAATGTSLLHVFQSVSGGRGFQIQRSGTGASCRVQVQNGATTNLVLTNFFDGTPNIYSFCIFSSTQTIEAYRNGVLQGSIAYPVGTFDQTQIVNNFMSIGGSLGELIVISNKPKDQADIDLCVGYLAHEWGLQAKLDPAQPYVDAAPLSSPPVLTPLRYNGTYGQSWVADNGSNGAFPALQTPQAPNNVLMVSSPAGIVDDVTTEGTFVAAFEEQPLVQSLTHPLSLRLFNDIGSGIYLCRHSAEGGKSIEELGAPEAPYYDGISPFYNDFRFSLDRIKQIAEVYNYQIIPDSHLWCHGANNPSDTEAQYQPKFVDMLDRINADFSSRFGTSPLQLIILSPGGKGSGEHGNIIAQLKTAVSRTDCILVAAGAGIEKYTDGLHFTNEGCVDVGEMIAIKRKYFADTGIKWHTPYCLDEHVSRNGAVITMNWQSIHDLTADESINSPSHWRFGAPVENLGLEYTGAAINSVVVSGKVVTITLASAAAGTLKYCFSNIDPLDGYTRNRGNIRSVWTGVSNVTGNTLYDWAASGSWDL